MDYFRNLTINQMIAALVVVAIVLLAAMVAFNISRQPNTDIVATATPFRPGNDFQFLVTTPTPTP